MAPSFFSKLAKATTSSSTTSNGDSTTSTKNATTDTKDEKRRSSVSRDRSSGTTTKSTNDTPSNTHTPRSSFQFGISTLTRAASRNRAVSSPSAANGKNSAHNSTTNLHRKVESAGATPPVPPVPDSLTASPPAGTTRGRRNSIISVVFGGGKAQDNSSIVPQESSADSSAIQGPPSIQLDKGADDDDDDIPRIGIVGSASRESINSSELGVTIVPPSPLVYTASLASTHSSSAHDFPAAVEEAPTIQGPEDNSIGQQSNQEFEATPLATPTQEQPATTTTASVLVSIFGRRARTSSISSAISGIIGVGAPAKDKPAPVEVINVEQDSNGVSPVTPTTATTIKAHPLPTRETPPPLPGTKVDGNMAPSAALSPGHEVQRKASSRSLTNLPPPIIVPDHGASLSPAGNSSKSGTHHARAATTPPEAVHDNAPPTVTMTPIVESPTALKSDFLISPSSSSSSKDQRNRAASTSAQSSGGGFTGMLSPKKGGDDDTASIISTASKSPGKEEKKRLFKRSTTRKPTGLASAIAATGLAMANPSISAMHSAQMNAAAASQTDSKSPYLSKSPTASVLSTGQRSATSVVSPRSGKSTGRKVSGGSTGKSPSSSSFALHSAGSKKSSRRPSMSAYSDAAASTGGLSAGAPSEYYSGNESERVRPRRRPTRSASRVGGHSGDESDTEDEEDSSEEDSSDDDDVLDDLDLEDDDIPVTGFAVASNKRNADFHELFPNVPEGDYLIEDYGCALQREILIQGRLYISENHICFHANIFGWITDLSIPIDEITTLEKKMTAFVIPNAIQITTRQSRYSFASFLSRDTTYDVIYNIWRLARPDDVRSIRSGQSLASGGFNGVAGPGATANGVESRGNVESGGVKKFQRKATHCACGREGRHFTEVAMEATFPGSPEMIHNLMFASGFIKEFFTVDQKLLDIQMADWMPVSEGSNLLTRNMTYIKPLNASMGPKQTKCEIKDEMEHQDLDDYISTITTTRTPDVPSGGVFSVKTRTCIMWAGPISSKVLVTTQVEWTGRSFIKGIIERSAIDGQKVYHGDLEKAMRAYIQEHHSEFVPEGMDTAELEAAEEVNGEDPKESGPAPTSTESNGANVSQEEREKQRERERNQRAWQWLLDTFEGAFNVAKQSTKTAWDLLRDAWDQSSSTTILYFVILILVISNLYTLIRMGKKEEVGRRKEMMKQEERERWVQSVVSTLWDELAAGKQEAIGLREKYPPHPPLSLPSISPSSSMPESLETPLPPVESLVATPGSWKDEVAHLHQTLALVEERIKSIKLSLAEFEKLDNLD